MPKFQNYVSQLLQNEKKMALRRSPAEIARSKRAVQIALDASNELFGEYFAERAAEAERAAGGDKATTNHESNTEFFNRLIIECDM